MTENIRAKILAEALREINRHGSNFHMDDLARNLRISKRTLYENFSSKQEIIEQDALSILNLLNYDMTALFASLGINTRGGEFVYVEEPDMESVKVKAE